MNRERWQQIDRIFEAVLERPAADRLAFVADECGNDHQLRAEVESLLAAHDRDDTFLDRTVIANSQPPLEGDESSSLVGETLGNYRIVRRLGIGGMSEVYLGHDRRLARPVAIKLLSRYRTEDENNVHRFHQEALAASALNHPNILTIYEIGEWQGRDFIAAEFVDGVTLREYLRLGILPIYRSLDIALQVASAIAAAHSADVVHRDIKPENIIVRPDGLVKVLDFGIAKCAGPRRPAVFDTELRTATGMVIGTAAYMSPEQARGQGVDARTDIWSLGVVLYEMVTGRSPFPGATPSDRIAAILEREPEPVREVRRDAPAGLDNVVRRALAKDCDERYCNAAVFAQDLKELRAELGVDHRIRRPHRLHKRMRIWLLATGVTAAVAGLSYFGAAIRNSQQSHTAVHSETISSLAVLPLANTGGTAEMEYLSDGITDSLINDLSEIPSLKVMSRNSVFRYKSLNVNAQKVAESLKVRAVLAGRMIRHGDTLSVTVELVDARDNRHIWGGQYQRKLANIFDLEQNIARDITEGLRLELSKEERDRLARRRTKNTEAYQLYLKGQFYWLKHALPSWRPGSAPDFSKSREFFQRAIEADPGYALAYAWLGHYYAMSAGNGLMHPEEGWPKAEAAFRKALELDPMLPEAQSGLAVVQWIDHRDWAAAEKQLRLALQLNPNIGGGLYPRILATEWRFEQAIAEARRAIDFDPLSIRNSGALAQILYYARRYEECIRQCRQALELDPNDVAVHEILGNAYEQMGHFREAVIEWRATLLLAGDRGTALILDRTYRRGGFTAAERAVARRSLQLFSEMTQRGRFVPATEYARAHLSLGEKEEALRWLTKACDEHTVLTVYIGSDPFYDELRADPRFQEIVKRIHAPR